MFQAGDYVVYGSNGLCRVEQVGVPDFETFERNKPYYFLRSQLDGTRIYAPTDTRQPLRAPITQEQANQLLDAIPAMPVNRPNSRDRKSVMQYYQNLIHDPTCENLALILKSMHARHLSSAEDALRKKAESQLCAELSSALSCSSEDALRQLTAALGKSES